MSSSVRGPSVASGSQASDDADKTSLGSLLGQVTQDLSALMRLELDLAKAELRESGSKAGKGAGLLGGAGVAGHFVLLFLSLALMWGLAELVGLGWAALIVAVIWAIVAAALALQGKKEMKAIRGMPDTAVTVKEIPPTLKPGEHTP